jgi:hypothetical protein
MLSIAVDSSRRVVVIDCQVFEGACAFQYF